MLLRKSKLLLVGAGGQGMAAASVARAAGFRVKGWLDDEKQRDHILGPVRDVERWAKGCVLFLAVGDNLARAALSAQLGKGYEYACLVHPTAVVSPGAVVGEGSIVMPFAFVGPGARIGRHCIVNTAAVVEHGCRVGDFSHICPNAALGGNVYVGGLCQVGIGASVRNGVCLGDRCVVGAGAAVVCDLPEGVFGGVPAIRIKETDDD